MIRRKIKKALYAISPALGRACTELWSDLVPVVSGRMTVRNSTKYLVRGLIPGLRGRFDYHGTRVYFPKASFLFRKVCEKGTWEPEVTAWLCRAAKPNKLFIDVGANIGLTSIPVLRNVLESRVLSFEPSPNSLPYLQRTWRTSKFHDRWEIVPKAASNTIGSIQFHVGDPRNAAWDGLRDTMLDGGRHAIEIPQTTVDLEWERLGRPAVSCIKIDVEGAETKVLIGAEQLVRQERPYIILEWARVNLAPYGTDPGFLLQYARTHAYDVQSFPCMAPVSELQELEREMHQAEMFLLAPKQKMT
jgi:FkbM family methyltransferase